MKKLILPLMFLTNSLYGQIIYVDNFDGVYPFTQSTLIYNFDLNQDAINDCTLNFGSWSGSCFNGSSSGPSVRFKGISNTFGQI